ncbi:hypothetical protein [Streptomyces sp. UNOC14_S4]|uniref:hypothetical protein n=1 Tax=Streptomyces sp. UNOC14_S4 TaxID=2872340 RepID=UPI001E3769E9|nr:hypothetical protein [Streptomyces sp. UNOC14_S4]MCC3769036.1 hypothetical protein [Streptomyces sp. UNOC14_S4]
MTYSEGAWVLDKRLGGVGQVVGHGTRRVRLRSPDGTREWSTEPHALRLASQAELRDAGLRHSVSWIGPSVTLVYMPPRAEGGD